MMIPRYKALLVSKFKVALGAAARRFLRWFLGDGFHGDMVKDSNCWQGSDLILAMRWRGICEPAKTRQFLQGNEGHDMVEPWVPWVLQEKRGSQRTQPSWMLKGCEFLGIFHWLNDSCHEQKLVVGFWFSGDAALVICQRFWCEHEIRCWFIAMPILEVRIRVRGSHGNWKRDQIWAKLGIHQLTGISYM
jgi:hypothetical protein